MLREALAQANTLQDEACKNRALTNIAKTQALQNFNRGSSLFYSHDFPLPDQALETINLIQDPAAKDAANREIAIAQHLEQLQEEIGFFGRHHVYTLAGTHDNIKGDALCQILKASALARPEQINDLLLQGLTQASLLPDERHQMITYLKVVQALT
jgi:hypothetical protein